MLAWTLAFALATPSIDQPLRTGAKAPNDAAVVIGIEDYAFLPDVPYAERDAQAMEDVLVYTLGIPYDRVRRLGENASREQILTAVDEAADLVGPEGTLWLYYAGHGAASASSGERILLGVDTMANAQSFEARAVPVSALKAAAGDVHRTVLMVDACYAGASRGGQDLLAGKRFAVPSYVKPTTGGWIEWNAAQPDELSGPLEPVQHGAFTFAAVGALRGWADGQLSGEPDGTITLEEAQLFVAQTLRTVDVHDQKPDLAAADLAAPLAAVPVDKLEAAPSAAELKALLTATPASPSQPPPSTGTPDVSNAEVLAKLQQLEKINADIARKASGTAEAVPAPPPKPVSPEEKRYIELRDRINALRYTESFDKMKTLSIDVGSFMADPSTKAYHEKMRTLAHAKHAWWDPETYKANKLVQNDRLYGAYRGGKSGNGNVVGGALMLFSGLYFIASVPVVELIINDQAPSGLQEGFTAAGLALAIPGAIMYPIGLSRSAKTKKEVRARYGLDGSPPAWEKAPAAEVPATGTADEAPAAE